MSWLVERDVRRGRDRLNLSDWHQYTLTQQEQLLAAIASAVKNREMPLPQYTLIHRDARLSDADTDLIYGWARVERRRLRASSSVVSRASAKQLTVDSAEWLRLLPQRKAPKQEYFARPVGSAK